MSVLRCLTIVDFEVRVVIDIVEKLDGFRFCLVSSRLVSSRLEFPS